MDDDTLDDGWVLRNLGCIYPFLPEPHEYRTDADALSVSCPICGSSATDWFRSGADYSECECYRCELTFFTTYDSRQREMLVTTNFQDVQYHVWYRKIRHWPYWW